MLGLARASALRWFEGMMAALDHLDALQPPPPDANTMNFPVPPDDSVVRSWITSPRFASAMAA